jgi:hypothetical protein
VPAHYLHSSGNFNLYDKVAKVLFSGDVGAALLPPGEDGLFVENFDKHIRHAEGFHRRWMGSNEAKRRWCERVSQMDIDMLCPQHGAIYQGADVQRFINWFDESAGRYRRRLIVPGFDGGQGVQRGLRRECGKPQRENMTTIRSFMTDDHRHCDDLFAEAEQAIGKKNLEAAQAAFGHFRTAVLAHFDSEEKTLFPTFRSQDRHEHGADPGHAHGAQQMRAVG